MDAKSLLHVPGGWVRALRDLDVRNEIEIDRKYPPGSDLIRAERVRNDDALARLRAELQVLQVRYVRDELKRADIDHGFAPRKFWYLSVTYDDTRRIYMSYSSHLTRARFEMLKYAATLPGDGPVVCFKQILTAGAIQLLPIDPFLVI